MGDTPVVWLSSQGWQSTGRASGREVAPTSDGIAHAMTPARMGQWLAARTQTLAGHGITVRCTYGGSCGRWSAEVTARAWAALRTHGDSDGAVGSCTGGVVPDGLVLLSLPQGPEGEALHARLIGGPPADADDLAETTYLVEAESSLKANAPLRGKVEQLSAACETLGAARGVLWIVRTRDVARRLRDLGVDDVRRPAHFLVPARDLGMGGEDIGPARRPWWALAVPPDPTDIDPYPRSTQCVECGRTQFTPEPFHPRSRRLGPRWSLIKDAWDAENVPPGRVPPRPSTATSWGVGWEKRLGEVIPDSGGDRWWSVLPGDDLAVIARKVTEALDAFGLRAVEQQLASAAEQPRQCWHNVGGRNWFEPCGRPAEVEIRSGDRVFFRCSEHAEAFSGEVS